MINQILQNPDSVKEIIEIAEKMGMQIPIGSAEENQEQTVNQMLTHVSQLVKETDTGMRRQETLIRALLPYLSPQRQARLERAMQLSQFSRMAETALLRNSLFSMKDGDGEFV